MNYETLQLFIEDNVAHIILNRPEEANTLTKALVEDFCDVVRQCAEDPKIRAVLLSAAKGRFFSAGGDLGYFHEQGDNLPNVLHALLERFHPAVEIFSNMDAPVVVAVDGVAAGIGLSMVLNSSYVIASENASFCVAYTGAGLTPDGGASYLLPRVVGLRRAEELILTNRVLNAHEAEEWGLINQVVKSEMLNQVAMEMARNLAKGPTKAFGASRRLLLQSYSTNMTQQLFDEGVSIAEMTKTQDGREGIASFLEKRAANFIGQ